MISILRSALLQPAFCFVVLACFVLATYSPASAQEFQMPTTIESLELIADGKTTYQIKGTATAINIPQAASQFTYKFEFQKQTNLGNGSQIEPPRERRFPSWGR